MAYRPCQIRQRQQALERIILIVLGLISAPIFIALAAVAGASI